MNKCLCCGKIIDENHIHCQECKDDIEIEQFLASIEAEFGLN